MAVEEAAVAAEVTAEAVVVAGAEDEVAVVMVAGAEAAATVNSNQ
jgi:hypothetical protein